MSADKSGGHGRRSTGLAGVTVLVGVLAAVALFAGLSGVAVRARPHSVVLLAGLAVAVAFGFLLIGLWLWLVFPGLGGLDDGSDGAGGEGWGRGGPDPGPPHPPSDGPDLWPELERELREYLEERERAPVAG